MADWLDMRPYGLTLVVGVIDPPRPPLPPRMLVLAGDGSGHEEALGAAGFNRGEGYWYHLGGQATLPAVMARLVESFPEAVIVRDAPPGSYFVRLTGASNDPAPAAEAAPAPAPVIAATFEAAAPVAGPAAGVPAGGGDVADMVEPPVTGQETAIPPTPTPAVQVGDDVGPQQDAADLDPVADAEEGPAAALGDEDVAGDALVAPQDAGLPPDGAAPVGFTLRAPAAARATAEEKAAAARIREETRAEAQRTREAAATERLQARELARVAREAEAERVALARAAEKAEQARQKDAAKAARQDELANDAAELDDEIRRSNVELNALMNVSERIGRNSIGQDVYQGPASRFVWVEGRRPTFEGDSGTPGSFLRATDPDQLAMVADAFVRHFAMFRDEPLRTEDLARFARVVFGLPKGETIEPADPRYLRLAAACQSALSRQVWDSEAQVGRNRFREAVKVQRKSQWLTDLDRHAGEPPLPLPLAESIRRIVGEDAGNDGKKTVISGFPSWEPGRADGLLVFSDGADEAGSAREAFRFSGALGADTAVVDRLAVPADMAGAKVVVANLKLSLLDRPARFDGNLVVGRADLEQAVSGLLAREPEGRTALILRTGASDEEKAELEATRLWIAERFAIEDCADLSGTLHANNPAADPLRVIVVGRRRPALANPKELANALRKDTVKTFDELWTWTSKASAARAKIDRHYADQQARAALEDAAGEREDNVYQVPYVSASRLGVATTMIPKNLEGAVQEALQNLVRRHGDIDEMCARALWITKDQLGERLTPEQIDAFALYLDADERGRASLLADMTGIGKGRVLACVMLYWALQGKKSIFFTEREGNLSDIWRDIRHIKGDDVIVPFILNSDAVVTDEDTDEVLLRSLPREEQMEFFAKMEWPEGCNLVLGSYTQVNKLAEDPVPAPRQAAAAAGVAGLIEADVQAGAVLVPEGVLVPDVAEVEPDAVRGPAYPPNLKSRWIRKVADKHTVLILDESHNAAGESNTAANLVECRDRCANVMFSSATFAEKASNLALYSPLLPPGLIGQDNLANILRRGGETAQETLSSMLAQDGVFCRREHTMGSCEFIVSKDVRNEQRNLNMTDELAPILAQMAYLSGDLDEQVNQNKLEIERELHRLYPEKKDVKRHLQSLQFSRPSLGGKLYNISRLFDCSLLIDHCVDVCVEGLLAGKKPLVLVENTIQGILSDILSETEEAEAAGEFVEGERIPDFRDVMRRCLRQATKVSRVASIGKDALALSALVQIPENLLVADNPDTPLAEGQNWKVKMLFALQDAVGQMNVRRAKSTMALDQIRNLVDNMPENAALAAPLLRDFPAFVSERHAAGRIVKDLAYEPKEDTMAWTLAGAVTAALPPAMTEADSVEATHARAEEAAAQAAAGAVAVPGPPAWKGQVNDLLLRNADPLLTADNGDVVAAALQQVRDAVNRLPDDLGAAAPGLRSLQRMLKTTPARAVRRINEMIDRLPDLPASAIDMVRDGIEKRGQQAFAAGEIPRPWRVEEITGRTQEFRDGKVVARKKARNTEVKNRFNRGDTDVVIFNVFTGMDFHSSARFLCQKQRMLVCLQEPAPIKKLLQAFGRVNRLGQVVPPQIVTLVAGIPIEEWLLSMRNARLRRMSANTTSNRDHVNLIGGIVDMINVVGDAVCTRFMSARPDVLKRMNFKVDDMIENEAKNKHTADGETETQKDAKRSAGQVMSRLAVFPCEEQRQYIEQITAEFLAEIEERNARNDNPLLTKMVEGIVHLRNERPEDRVLISGVEGENLVSTFFSPVYAQKGIIEKPLPPLKARDVSQMLRRGEMALGGDPPTGIAARLEHGKMRILRAFAPTELTVEEAIAAEKPNRMLVTEHQNLEKLISVLREIRPGKAVNLKLDGAEVEAYVTLFKIPGPRDVHLSACYEVHLVAPGWTKPERFSLKALMADPTFKIGEGIEGPRGDAILQAFEGTSKQNALETRMFLVGNEWEAMRLADENGLGSVTNFKDQDGIQRRGILVPKDKEFNITYTMPVGLAPLPAAAAVRELRNAAAAVPAAAAAQPAARGRGRNRAAAPAAPEGFMVFGSRDMNPHGLVVKKHPTNPQSFIVQMPSQASRDWRAFNRNPAIVELVQAYNNGAVADQPVLAFNVGDLDDIMETLADAGASFHVDRSHREWANRWMARNMAVEPDAPAMAA